MAQALTVPRAAACPNCGTRDMDTLRFLYKADSEDNRVGCHNCGHVYDPEVVIVDYLMHHHEGTVETLPRNPHWYPREGE